MTVPLPPPDPPAALTVSVLPDTAAVKLSEKLRVCKSTLPPPDTNEPPSWILYLGLSTSAEIVAVVPDPVTVMLSVKFRVAALDTLDVPSS